MTPRAFMVNAPEREVDLIPDWLKLKMIRSEVPPLVDAALVELDPGKLVLFIQSFGIPVPRYVIPNLWENDRTTRGRSQTMFTKFVFFRPPNPLRLYFLWYKSLQKVDCFDHLPPSSCKRSL